jgi:hypothetical protein
VSREGKGTSGPDLHFKVCVATPDRFEPVYAVTNAWWSKRLGVLLVEHQAFSFDGKLSSVWGDGAGPRREALERHIDKSIALRRACALAHVWERDAKRLADETIAKLAAESAGTGAA